MEAKVLTVFNQKGGVGKTNTAVQLAGTFGARGVKTFLIDMDAQNTAVLWAANAPADRPFPATVVSMAPLKENFIERVPAYVSKYDLIVIDCPPAIDSPVPWAALTTVSDFALIPVITLLGDIQASRQAEELVLAANAKRIERNLGSLPGAFVESLSGRGKIYDVHRKDLQKKAKIPILKSTISRLNAFPESLLYGCVVGDFGKSTAAAQVDALVDEVAGLLKIRFPKLNATK
jgi:chromosome partitioning protein